MHEAKYTLCQTSCSGVKRALHTQVLNVADISLVSSRVAGRLASLYNTEIFIFSFVRLLITPPNTPPIKANQIRALCPAVNLIRFT